MTSEPPADDDRDDQDRVVSRHVRNATSAEPGDEAAYQAANPTTATEPPDTTGGASDAGVTTATAAQELAEENGSEPDRSE